ncbi:MAG: hypothetical protein HY023_12635 [Chloroflexi bacterium]|nr:hypothetical protein [Chloroflexota bacterium]MBI3761911.1 hypothetical protein [Chloroflexota bacterium]
MGEKLFTVGLEDSENDRYRFECRTAKGRVVLFSIQYEAKIQGKWVAIIRFDTAHGFPHQDTMHPGKSETKTRFPGLTNSQVLTLGQNDIKENWRKYRTAYEREMEK